MPEMNGLETLKEIKKQDKEAKVIMCSAMSQKSFIQEALSYGAHDFILKPFEPFKIIEALAKCFRS